MKYEWLDEYILSKVGVEKDYKVEWDAFRYLIKGKMIGMICKNKEGIELINLKCDPDFGIMLRNKYKDIVPGYYMNKVHWNALYLKGDVPDSVLKQMIDNSYELIFAALPKKTQKAIKLIKQ